MAEGFDVLVVGAGIVGTACAAELAAAGLAVGVVERDVVGSGATGAGMGHLVAMDGSPAELALTSYSRSLWDALVAERPAGCEYLGCGTLWVAADAEELAAVQQKHAVYAAHGITSEVLDEQALSACEPALRRGLAGGLLVSGDGVVYPPQAALLLLERARQHGARLLHGTVAQLRPDGADLQDGTVLGAAAVVLANGTRAVDLLPELPIRPKKGHLAITDRYPGFLRHQLVELGYVKNAHAVSGTSVAFNLQPRPSGQVLVGSSRQIGVATAAVDPQVLAQMLARAFEYVPTLARLACIRVWTGFRPATPDGLPLIGPHPGRPGVWLAAGHEGLGITTALGTAKLLAAQLLGRRPAVPAAPYLPARVLAEAARA